MRSQFLDRCLHALGTLRIEYLPIEHDSDPSLSVVLQRALYFVSTSSAVWASMNIDQQT